MNSSISSNSAGLKANQPAVEVLQLLVRRHIGECDGQHRQEKNEQDRPNEQSQRKLASLRPLHVFDVPHRGCLHSADR